MAILKIRDAEGNVIEIPTLKGDSYILTEADKIEIAEIVKSSIAMPTTDTLTEEQVLELIRENMPVSAEEVDY